MWVLLKHILIDSSSIDPKGLFHALGHPLGEDAHTELPFRDDSSLIAYRFGPSNVPAARGVDNE
jgi:hypothetical protein